MVSRREFLASTAALPAAGRTSRPNVIVFLADDLGCHDLGFLSPDLKTPNIDALAAGGARFTNWYAAAPVCAPSRGALMSGRYPQRCGVPNNGQALAPSEKSIADLLKPHGYATGLFGKWHLGSTPETCPNAHGFDTFFGFHSGCVDFYSHRYYWGDPKLANYHDLWRNRTEVFEDGQYLTELITREAKAFLTSNQTKPFFMYVPYNAVHYPMHAPRKYVERFAGLQPERRMYAAMLSALDDSVGEILSTVKRLGQASNTLVFMTADNGATTEARAGLNNKPATAGSNRPFRGNKFSLFDGGMHPPFVMNWPGLIPAGQVINEVGCHTDILPTICKAANIPLPADRIYDGFDAMPMAVSKAKSPHEAVFWSSGNQLAVRRGKWKLVKDGILADGTENRGRMKGEDALFLSNLETDPGESRNLRRENPALLDELLTLAEKWQREVNQK